MSPPINVAYYSYQQQDRGQNAQDKYRPAPRCIGDERDSHHQESSPNSDVAPLNGSHEKILSRGLITHEEEHSFGIKATWSWTATVNAVTAMKDLSCVGKHSTLYTISSISCTAMAGPNGSFIVTGTMTQTSPKVCFLGGFYTPHVSQTITDVRQVKPPALVVVLSQTV